MIGIQECVGSMKNLESFLNNGAVRLGWKIISVQKTWFWNDPFRTGWIVTYEKEDKS